jgi:hypothetical protein
MLEFENGYSSSQLPVGHDIATVVPMLDRRDRTEYHVLVFRQGLEVCHGTERSSEEAIRTASDYLNWRTEQDLDS